MTITTSLLWSCSGYYDYDGSTTPELPGLDRFAGRVVHPQHWPADLDVTGQRVLVVGSGATAVTLVPALARDGAAHVTMLQRSPTYVLSMPARDPVAGFLQRWLPERASYAAVRWKNVLVATGSYQLSRRRPDVLRRFIRKQTIAQLPEGYDVDTHFRPTYDPWDQRLCLVPDGDLFQALSRGTASVATDTIATFTETGVRLASGRRDRGRPRGDRHRAQRDAVRQHRPRRRRRAGQAPGDDGLPGADAVRGAELRLHHRLHQRVLDPEGRPGRGVRLSAARAPRRARLPRRSSRRATPAWPRRR